MPQIQANGITLEYEVFGSDHDPVALLIMGLGQQLTRWPVPFCEKLAVRGFRVIRFDNRDTGRSTWMNAAPAPELRQILGALMSGQPVGLPYTLQDMANDTVGLLAALRIPAAHIVGASMGGMIAQLIAADHPQRTLSLASIMSTSGNPALPQPQSSVAGFFTGGGQDSADQDIAVNLALHLLRLLSGPGYPFDADAARERIVSDMLRGHNPAGVARHIAASAAAGDRRAKLHRIVAPTVVIHGEGDPLFLPQAARDTAENINGAHLRLLPGMGHDLPPELYDVIVDAIVKNARRAVPQ